MQLMRYTFFIIFFQIGQNRIIYWLSMNYVTFMLQKLGILRGYIYFTIAISMKNN